VPGLVRGIARTAVIAGTATAVSGRVQRRQAEKFAGRDAQIYADRQAAYQQQTAQPQYAVPAASYQNAAPPAPYAAPQYAPPPAPAAPAEDDLVSKIKQLSDLRDQGILTDEEFAAAKAKLISG
jgi:Short C-terminal domain